MTAPRVQGAGWGGGGDGVRAIRGGAAVYVGGRRSIRGGPGAPARLRVQDVRHGSGPRQVGGGHDHAEAGGASGGARAVDVPSLRVAVHSIAGCFFYGAFTAKVLLVHSRRLPG